MPRHAGLVAVILASLSGTGCAADGQWSARRMFGWDEVKVERDPKIPREHTPNSERIDTLGRRIIAQNTFTGIEPMFFAIGVPESVLFHRGAEELFISDGLVKKCKTEAELAAVLCSELGQMMAEKRGARRVGADRDTFTDSSLPGSSIGGGTPDDPGRAAEIAFRERRQPKSVPNADPVDSERFSRDLMKGAGFDADEIERIQPLLKQSSRGNALRKQMSNSAPAPEWK